MIVFHFLSSFVACDGIFLHVTLYKKYLSLPLGLSNEEFDKFLARVPTHLKDKFKKVANDFSSFDKNKDNVIDYNELSTMLDLVMKDDN